MTTETKPIIDLSEWDRVSLIEWERIADTERATIWVDKTWHYFNRKPKPVKSLEEKVREAFPGRDLDVIVFHDLQKIARIIEEHANERGWNK